MRLSRSTSHLLLASGSVALVALLVYLPFRSVSLDDFDAYNFVRALSEFAPAQFQPHPPGYVLYVWLGRLALALSGDARLALTTLSALSASMACGLLFLTAALLFNRRTALIAVILVIASPLMWLNAGKALSDATGLCAQAVGALLLALAARRGALWLALAAGWTGLAAGFRPQAVLGLVAAWLVLALWVRVSWRTWLAGGLAAVLGGLTWLLPTLAALQWNVDALRGYLGGAAGFVAGQESLFATALTGQSFAARLEAVWYWSSRAVFGPQAEWVLLVLGLGAVALALYGVLRPVKPGARPVGAGTSQVSKIGVWLCVAWFLPQALLQLFFLNPELTRYLLALLFPAALLIAWGLQHAMPPRAALTFPGQRGERSLHASPIARGVWSGMSLVVALGFSALTGTAALPLVKTLHTVPAPPDQLAAYLLGRLPREQTMIVARQSYNALAYYLPGWQVRFADAYDPAALAEELEHSQIPFIVIADPEAIQPAEQHVQIEAMQFTRDPQVHAKHATVNANLYGLTSALTPQDFALPEDGIIRVGTPQDGKYLLDGWYRREDIGGVPGRWMGSEDTATLRVLLPPRDAILTLRVMSFVPDQTLMLRCEDQMLLETNVGQQWMDVSVALPVACAQPDRPTRLSIRPSSRKAPAEDGSSTDPRTLAVAIAEMRFR